MDQGGTGGDFLELDLLWIWIQVAATQVLKFVGSRYVLRSVKFHLI